MRSQTIFPMFTNLPTDVIVNQMHFLYEGITPELAGAGIAAKLQAFYEAVYGDVGTGRASYIDWPLAKIKIFDLSDPTPRIPQMFDMDWSAGSNATSIPTEVACVLSFHAAPTSGVRFQALYNRIYLGGIVNSMMSGGAVDAFPRFNTTFQTAVGDAASAMLAANNGIIDWVQVSEAGGLTAVRPITGGWVDNGPDTQRRRSVLSSLRGNWS